MQTAGQEQGVGAYSLFNFGMQLTPITLQSTAKCCWAIP